MRSSSVLYGVWRYGEENSSFGIDFFQHLPYVAPLYRKCSVTLFFDQ
jgi:hypothetical protein